jgi:hypothetical protein
MRFGVNYMHCGCPLPGETIGQKLNRLIKVTSRQSPSFLLPPDDDDALLAGTHPSDHNSIFASHRYAQKMREKRTAKIAARKSRASIKGRASAIDHDTAFLTPVPIYYYAGVGIVGCFASPGVLDNGSAACASVSMFAYAALC